MDPAIGVYIIDRYTYYALDFLEKVTPDSKKTMAQFVSIMGCFANNRVATAQGKQHKEFGC